MISCNVNKNILLSNLLKTLTRQGIIYTRWENENEIEKLSRTISTFWKTLERVDKSGYRECPFNTSQGRDNSGFVNFGILKISRMKGIIGKRKKKSFPQVLRLNNEFPNAPNDEIKRIEYNEILSIK